MFRRIKIKPHERGLLFREGIFLDVLRPGVQWYFDPLLKLRVDVVSTRAPWLVHADLDLIVKSGMLAGEAIVADLKDHERALVWIDGRFARVLDRGLYALWTTEHDVRVEVVDARAMQLVHAELPVIVRTPGAAALLEVDEVAPGHAGLWFRDGVYQATLGAGTYAFWKDTGTLAVFDVDLKSSCSTSAVRKS